MNIFLHVGDAEVTARFYLHLHSGAATNVKCLSPSNLGRKQIPNRNSFMTHTSYLWCRAVPGPLSSAVTPVLPQHEGGDAVGRAASGREQGLPALALRCVKHHRALSSRLCWKNPMGQVTQWYQNNWYGFCQQSGPAEGTLFVGYMQKTKATFSAILLIHQNWKDLGWEIILPF